MAQERTTARSLLESCSAEPKQICAAIVSIGKPYDAQIIEEHASLVSGYLSHQDHVVRYQAVWFLGSWGHLASYAAPILHVAHSDANTDNRAYAARSLGSILRYGKDRGITAQLIDIVDDEKEEVEVRRSAYSGVLYAWNRPDDFSFRIGDKSLAEMDSAFLEMLRAWVEGRQDMTPVTSCKGVFRSLFDAWRTGLIFPHATHPRRKNNRTNV